MKNQKLFLYGLWSIILVFVGVVVAIAGAFVLLAFAEKWLGLVILIVGILIVLKAKAMRFDYKRQSGHILHGGDW